MARIVFRSENCSKHTGQDSYLLLWSTYTPFTYAEICLNSLNFILNTISFLIFSADKLEDRQVRFSLRFLSLIEVILAISKQQTKGATT